MMICIIDGRRNLNLGKGQLQFIPTPNHDSQMSFVPTTRTLKSCTLISYSGPYLWRQVLDEGWETFNEDRRYYDCLMASHARQVETALETI